MRFAADIDLEHSFVGCNGGVDTMESMERVCSWGAPESHDTISDVFIESAVINFDGFGLYGEVFIDGFEHGSGLEFDEFIHL